MTDIGDRVLEQMRRSCPDVRQQDVAQQVGMTPDAFSRALRGQRNFSSLELARLAERLDTDLYRLITGEPDPHRLFVAARHDFDHDTSARTVPGRASDEQTLGDIALAYRQAYPTPSALRALPVGVEAVRAALGPDFVRPFADRLEDALGIDVVRVQELSTAYSFTVGGRRVIAVPATGSWFRENWAMAHELGHLVLGHHDEDAGLGVPSTHEAAANAFAADLLLPAAIVTDIASKATSDADLADRIWGWGVSVDALASRLDHLTGTVPRLVGKWVGHPTQRLLRRHWRSDSGIDHITARMDAASQRRFPIALQETHLTRIASGDIGKGTLAWMLGIVPDMLDVDVPDQSEIEASELADALGL